MTKSIVVIGDDASVLLRIVKEEGFAGVHVVTRHEAGGKDTRDAYAQGLCALEQSSYLLIDVSGRRIDPEAAWACGYSAARGHTIIAFRGDSTGLLPLLLEHSTYPVATLVELRLVLRALGPDRPPYVPGSMTSFD